MSVLGRQVFKSWGEFVDKAENGKSALPDDQRASNTDQSEDWTKVKNKAEAIKLANEGWPQGTKSIKDMATPMFNHVSKMIERVEVNHDIEGHAIDVARFVDGEPEAWLKFENVIQEAENGHRMIRIAFNVSVSAGVNTEVIIRKGAAAAALVELLEYAGHRVELIVCHSAKNYGGDTTEEYIRLKEFDQNLDINVLSFALAHPAMLRCLVFSVNEQYPMETVRAMGYRRSDTYGRPTDIPEENQGDIYIGKSYGEDRQWDTPESAEAWVIDNLKKQGISLNLKARE